MLLAPPSQCVLCDRGQAKQAGGNETKARASCSPGSEGFRQVIELEVVHGGTSSYLPDPERFGAVLPSQQPALVRAVNVVTGCQSIG